jgi:hypothetical protein
MVLMERSCVWDARAKGTNEGLLNVLARCWHVRKEENPNDGSRQA